MKNILLLTAFVLVSFASAVTAQNVTVAGSASGNGDYTTLGAAITAIPLVGQEGNNITIAINASTAEAITGITIGAGTWSSLKIYPTAIATITAITPNTSTTPFITISGAKDVTIDGRLNQTGASSLTIVNSSTANSTAGSTIIFDNNAQNNTVKYCTIKGSQTGNFGIISFGATATVTNGNGLNIIDHNVITLNGTTPAKYGIYAIGNISFPNTGNQITNNEFKNLIGIYVATIIVNIAGGSSAAQNDNFTISGNSFFNTATIDNYASSNLSKTMIGIGSGTAAFGGSHTINDNFIGGTAANCGGTALTKRYKETTLNIMAIYPSGGTTNIQNNTIKNISWSNDYWVASMTGINIAGGSGDVNIGTVTGNTFGDNTTTGSFIFIAKSGADASVTLINIGTTGTVNCQNNKIGSFTAQHQTSARYINFTAISKNATAGATTISNNVIGSLTTPNSIYSYNTVLVAPTQIVNGISCSGTGSCIVSNNTIANLTNNTTTGNLYAINMNGVGSIGTVNANLIHSNNITGATTAMNYGIWCSQGTNTVTNNIVKIGDNNSYEIRAIGDAATATSTSMYHNTVYLGGAPTSLALNSACLYSLGTTNTRDFKNNLLVSARSNNGATGIHYALNMAENASGTIAVDGNNYFVSGTGGKLGIYGATESITSPQIVTANDAASISTNPNFANAGGTNATDYIPTAMAGVTGTGVTTDYTGTATRFAPTIGAFVVSPSTVLNTNKTSEIEFIRINDGQFELKGIEVGTAKVYSLEGKLIKTFNVNALNIIGLSSGVYVLSATDKSGAVYRRKFIL